MAVICLLVGFSAGYFISDDEPLQLSTVSDYDENTSKSTVSETDTDVSMICPANTQLLSMQQYWNATETVFMSRDFR